MGTWGTAIFSDDLAADLRGELKDLIGNGKTPEEATEQLKKDYSRALRDIGEGPVFWLALAASQWKLGRLTPEVKENALRVIDSGQDLKRWEATPALHTKRSKVLANLRETLNSEQPLAKKINPPYIDSTDWRIGQIIAYKLMAGDYCLLRVIGYHKDAGGTRPVVEPLDWRGESIPDRRFIKKLGIRACKKKGRSSRFMIGALSKREFPANRVEVTEIRTRPKQKSKDYTVTLWRLLDKDLDEFYGF
ncbi:MAG TPA: hypothetical protein VGL56_21290 [Fimbriimonadaceae bacterium]|jgi:hypothetical protein